MIGHYRPFGQRIPLYKLSRANQCKSFICNIHLRFSLIQDSFVFDSERLRIEKGTRFRPRALFQLLLDFISAASNSPKSNQRNRPNLSIICPTKNHYYLYTFNYIIYFKHTWRLLLYFLTSPKKYRWTNQVAKKPGFRKFVDFRCLHGYI